MKYRHGDVPLYKIEEVEGEVLNHEGSFVLAVGEATGHHHRIKVANVEDMEIRRTGAGYILVLKSDGQLSHEEHGTLIIAPGMYRVGNEIEKDWFALKTQRVVD